MHPLLKTQSLIRWARFDLSQVFAQINHAANRAKRQRVWLEIDGTKFLVYLDNATMLTYAREQACYACGVKGTLLFLESNTTQRQASYGKGYIEASFQLYALKDEMLIPMNKDHIVPTDWSISGGGGPHEIEKDANYKRVLKETCENIGIDFHPEVWHRTMCTFCNGNKSNSTMHVKEIRKKTKLSWNIKVAKKNGKYSFKDLPRKMTTTNADAPIVDFRHVFRSLVEEKPAQESPQKS